MREDFANIEFQLIETLIYTPPSLRPVDSLLYPAAPNRPTISDIDFALMKLHLGRLKKSATYFEFHFGSQYARRSLHKAVKKYQKESGKKEILRVRLLQHRNGAVSVNCFPFTPDPEDKVISFAISEKRLDSTDEFLKHKTTRRALFDSEHDRLSRETGCDEVLFLNERDELCEGSRSNLFIVPKEAQENDKMLTPAHASGLLPGTLRQKLLMQKRATEAVLTLRDLEGAEKIYFGNSVRGLQQAKTISQGNLQAGSGQQTSL